MKSYKLVVKKSTDTVTSKKILEKEIIAKNFNNIKKEAERFLENEKIIFNKNLEINLIDSKNNKHVHKMIWNDTVFGDGTGFFKGWKFFDNGVEYNGTPYTLRHSYLGPIVFSLLLLLGMVFLILNEGDVRNQGPILLYIFFTTLLYSTFSPVFRSNFNDISNSDYKVVGHNVFLELPIWIGTILTLYNFYKIGLFEEFNILVVGFVIIGYLLVKIIISIIMDIEKLSVKFEKK